MPGAGIPGFQRKAVEMALEGIYDQRQHHDEVLAPVLRYCGVFEVEGLSGEGEKARTELAEFLTALDASASRFVERRDALKARRAARH
jgi:acyl-[acyl-carrier-protein] desaturase